MSKVFITFLILFCLFIDASASTDSFNKVRYELKFSVSNPYLQTTVENSFTFELYYNADTATIITPRADYSLRNGSLVIVDKVYNTYIETETPVNIPSLLSDVSILRYLNTDKRLCTVNMTDETKEILGKTCSNAVFADTSGQRLKVNFWQIDRAEVGGLSSPVGTLLAELAKCLLLDYDLTELEKHASALQLPLGVEISIRYLNSTVTLEIQAVEMSENEAPPKIREYQDSQQKKQKSTWGYLTAGHVGPVVSYTGEQQHVYDVIREFADGYVKRDVSIVDEWTKKLCTDDVFVLGTDAPFPDTWEWRAGREGARSMFARDWKYWGDVEIFDDEVYIKVEGDAAHVIAFGTVARIGSDDDASRKRTVARIREYADEEWSSLRKLYEILAVATQTLAQYERGHDFIWNLRLHFTLVKRNGNWKISVIHWSHPARGFRSWRLLNTSEK